jgi:hypothetical protein
VVNVHFLNAKWRDVRFLTAIGDGPKVVYSKKLS